MNTPSKKITFSIEEVVRKEDQAIENCASLVEAYSKSLALKLRKLKNLSNHAY